MFTELHLSITEQYGEHGRGLVQKGLEAFGLKDAEAMAKRQQQKAKIILSLNIYHQVSRVKRNLRI